ncbi:DUF1836 domain-containing protein [Oceanobacillus rekensis]|uniref:DUF1836 domain-containing protein n=1 Tax=Oceanobacillus rekensis TaxID=937927 RepID=UPI000B4521E7|nr:DUF1836 domain-containing protein [Oceanobacillus rekensis]
MKNKNKLMESLNIDNHLLLEDIPNLDLYMDQVIQLFEDKFGSSKRNDDEKILTKTMINNYAKGKLFFPIKNKKYSKEHLILISMIYQMKSSLSINDVKMTLEQLNAKITDEEFDLQQLYQCYLNVMAQNSMMFKSDVREQWKEIENEVKELDNDDATYLEQVLLVATFSSMSNYYRRAAEKIVDAMKEEGNTDEA